jgi:exonuclease SbcC
MERQSKKAKKVSVLHSLLDRETLDIALDALDNLNASGKMIGVISHVDALKERISVQIEIKKMSGLGVSQLDKRFGVCG